MDKIAPRWVIWVSFVIFCLGGLGLIVFTLLDLQGLVTDPSAVMGNIIARVLMLYLLVYIPARIMYETQLKK